MADEWGWSKGPGTKTKKKNDTSKLHPGEKRKLRKAAIAEKRTQRAAGGGKGDGLNLKTIYSRMLALCTGVEMDPTDATIGVPPVTRYGAKLVSQLGSRLLFSYEFAGSGEKRAMILHKLLDKAGLPLLPDEQQLKAAEEVVIKWQKQLVGKATGELYDLNDERKKAEKRGKRRRRPKERPADDGGGAELPTSGGSKSRAPGAKGKGKATGGLAALPFVASGAIPLSDDDEEEEKKEEDEEEKDEDDSDDNSSSDFDDSEIDLDDSVDSTSDDDDDESGDDTDSVSSDAAREASTNAVDAGSAAALLSSSKAAHETIDLEATVAVGRIISKVDYDAAYDSSDAGLPRRLGRLSLGNGSGAGAGTPVSEVVPSPHLRGEWEAHTSGFGSKMLSKLGYSGGKLGSAHKRLTEKLASRAAASAVAAGEGSLSTAVCSTEEVASALESGQAAAAKSPPASATGAATPSRSGSAMASGSGSSCSKSGGVAMVVASMPAPLEAELRPKRLGLGAS